jgi:hypothetical protein
MYEVISIEDRGPKTVWNAVGKYDVTLNEDTEY